MEDIKFKIELTTEECLGIQILLERARGQAGVISAVREIDKLLEKFRNPSKQ